MGPDLSVNGYSFDLDSDEFDLESILREYENYDPDAPAPAPRAKAAFESRPIPAEIIDEPDTPEEPLGPLEQALAAPDPEPEEPDDAEHDAAKGEARGGRENERGDRKADAAGFGIAVGILSLSQCFQTPFWIALPSAVNPARFPFPKAGSGSSNRGNYTTRG